MDVRGLLVHVRPISLDDVVKIYLRKRGESCGVPVTHLPNAELGLQYDHQTHKRESNRHCCRARPFADTQDLADSEVSLQPADYISTPNTQFHQNRRHAAFQRLHSE